MAIIYSYPLAQPKIEDLLIGTSVYKETDLSSPRNNPTVSFTVSDLLALVGLKNGLQDLQSVTSIGASTSILSTFNGGVKIVGVLQDTNGNAGNATQVLQSTGTSVNWVNDERGTVNSVATTHAGDAFTASIGNVATVNPSVDVTMNGTALQYINGLGNLITFPTIPPNYVLPLAADGTRGGIQIGYTESGKNYPVELSGEKAFVNVPWTDTPYVLPLAADGTRGGVQIGYTESGKNYPVELSGEKMFVNVPWTDTTSDNWYVTGGSFTATTGVLAITGNNAVVGATIDLDGRYMSSLTTTGTTGVSTFNAATGILNIPNYTFTEADTLQTVTARGASSSIATNFTGSLTVNGTGAGSYFYVSGNAQSTAPPTSYDTGMAMVWNNSGGSRENEIYYATGSMSTVPVADRQGVNDTSYFAFINRFNPVGTPVDSTTLKLYGSGLLELTGPTATATIRNSHWRMPTTAAPNTGYVLAKASGSINLEWVPNANTTETFVLTAAQMQGLSSTPVTLLPSPGANKAYKILACSTYLNFTAVFAGTITSLNIYTTVGGSNSNQVQIPQAAVLATSSTIYSVSGTSFIHSPIYVNSALLIESDQAKTITGGTGNTFSIKLTYQILDTNNF